LERKIGRFMVVQVLIVVAVLALVALPLQSIRPSADANPIVPPPIPSSCAGQTEAWGPGFGYQILGNSTEIVPVLLMQPDTTGYVCVTYRSVSDATPGNVNPLAVNWTVEYWKDNFLVPSHAFEVSKSLLSSTSPFSSNTTVRYVSMVYSVTALANSTGFYATSFPLGYCGSMPIAVGHSDFPLKSSDFPNWYDFNDSDCLKAQYFSVEAGVIGLQVAYVKFPY
jgi:hypothetical protein